jgi:hypothetical protein
MKKQVVLYLSLIGILILTACTRDIPASVFHINGSPDPLLYGGCGDTLTLRVTGSGDNIRVDSIIASYNLYDGSGTKVKTGSIRLEPASGEPPVNYIGSVKFSLTTSLGGESPDSPIFDFGEGWVEFAAFVDAWYITPPDGGPSKPVGHTETKSLPVIPCLPTPTPIPTATWTIAPNIPVEPPPSGSGDKPPEPPISPPSCSVEPNNPNCVP